MELYELAESEDRGSVWPMNRPHARAVMIIVVGRDWLVAFPESCSAAIIFYNVSHALPQCDVIFGVEDGLIDDVSKDRQPMFFYPRVLLLEFCMFSLGQGRGAPHAPENHLPQLVAGVPLTRMHKTAD